MKLQVGGDFARAGRSHNLVGVKIKEAHSFESKLSANGPLRIC